SDSLNSLLGAKVNFIKPEIGDMKRLTELCEKNAREYIRIEETKESAELGTLKALAALLRLDKIPEIIESYDISNYGNENITGGKISVLNGKFNKKAYRTFKVRSTEKQDDFTSMYETVLRRLSHEEDTLPDLILIDGGEGQVKVAKDAVNELGLSIPVYGMVKDEYHKTRTLTDGENEISLAYNQSVYAFIYRIQEEVHRYTISRMQKAKGRSFKKSSLEEIKGIGPTKAKAILSYFGGLKNVKEAEKSQLSMVKCLSKADINNIYEHYHKEEI
ncbi:MAG: excinuclease ABC subunit C, partial [Firmicutes bacterium]|nr:excinuclease ABC subunit C [Candidatus Colimorpha enterica]